MDKKNLIIKLFKSLRGEKSLKHVNLIFEGSDTRPTSNFEDPQNVMLLKGNFFH